MQTLEKIKDADSSQPQNDTEQLYQQIADLKKKNDTIQFQLQRAEREKTVAVERAIKAEQERNQPAPPRGKEDDNEGGITNKDLQM